MQPIFIVSSALFIFELYALRLYDETHAKYFFADINEDLAEREHILAVTSWGYATNLTDENLKIKIDASSAHAKYLKKVQKKLAKFPWHTFQDFSIRRQFKKLSDLGKSALPDKKYEKLIKVISEMKRIFANGHICAYNDVLKCDLSLEPEITQIMANSFDPKELCHVWSKWRDVSGRRVLDKYPVYVDLINEAARLNNFTDNAEYWLQDFEADDIREQLEALWQQIRPFYMQIHAFVRYKLRQKYGRNVITSKGPIPAHLLGDMWAQTWGSIAMRTLPNSNRPPEDITFEMVKQGYTPMKMFKMAEKFYMSLNMSEMPPLFWKNSIIVKPKDRDIICHASAWDFYNGTDFRIKQCTDVTETDFYTVHHEMGHIQYNMQYKDQPLLFRNGANSGFHEAVGDVMALSVSTMKHLRKIGLTTSRSGGSVAALNHLYEMCLYKLVFLPFAYLVDLFRWDVFKGVIKPHQYNCEWWKLRVKYQGVEPPVDRTKYDFDAGAKYHVVADSPYIRYFISFIIQFQFHKALCLEAGEYDPNNASKPLHECDIYHSTKAGELLKKMLRMGSSRPWPEAMKAITGQSKMDASGLLEYFQPIVEYIQEKNLNAKQYIGWEPSTKKFGCDDDK